VQKHWRLNERSYGDLVGLNKKEVVKKFGKDQVKRWRRSYDEPPPPMNDDHEHHPKRDPRYRLVCTSNLPLTSRITCHLFSHVAIVDARRNP
jgi:2,3-bisphosphoglycerate-dependent phosphoglycerate mutase